MTSKIFKSIIAAVVAVLIATLAINLGALYPYFNQLQQTQLKDELHLAANAVQEIGVRYLDDLDMDRYRFTWVAADGTVLFDNQADAAAMENHADREEIREALLTGTGSSTRQSATLTEQTIYEAVRLSDGSVLRISVSRATAVLLLLGMLQPICIVLVIAIAISAWIAHRIAKRVVEPLNRLNLDAPLENDAYEELSPLLHRIHAQRQEIKEQMWTLERKQNEFNQITANMKEALVLLDTSARIISINPAARRLFGAGDDPIGNDILTIDRSQNMRAALENARADGRAFFRDQRNGRIYQFDLSRIASDNAVQGTVILAYDITDQANAEQNRQEFTANVSHELKTPLQSIIGSAELLENGIVKEADIPRFVDRIRKEATRLVNLIDDIIRLSQLDEGVDMPMESVSLRELSEEVCENLADAARQKDVSLKVTGSEGVITGVRRLLYEIVYNLCDNAIKYNRDGGSVEINLSQDADAVLLRVQDTGVGIAPEHQSKIFERFYRVDKSHSRQSGGTGLGLSIVKHAVQLHHGSISVESQPNVGTAITVRFDTKTRS
ncbi:MAG: ATP-binding protein [Clostridia bacterium]|nr:ATP-binding protein [Clostridia bacterium]